MLAYDEMSLKETVNYSVSTDEIEGKENLGPGSESRDLLANHASVFIVRSMTEKWKQPMVYFLTNGVMTAKTIKEKVVEAVTTLQSIGLDPRVLVCDQGANNCSAIKALGVTKSRPYFLKVYLLYDTPHLMKNIRTALKNFGFNIAGNFIKWNYIEQLLHYDMKKKIRMVARLTWKHLDLPIFSKMSVPLAAQLCKYV